MVIGMISNPGTGPVGTSSFSQARENIKQFVLDCSLDGMRFRRSKRQYHKELGDGRYGFLVSCGARSIEVQMPGIPIERLRYLSGDAWGWPRLYVDDNSWLWVFAVKEAFKILAGEEG